MAWTTPTSRATGDLITASIWNVDLKDNLIYLKAQLDIITDTSPTRAANTIYQNSTKIRFVVASFPGDNTAADGYFELSARIGSSTPPSIEVARCRFRYPTSGYTHHGMISFWVAPNHYYEIETAATNCTVGSPLRWVEWDFH